MDTTITAPHTTPPAQASPPAVTLSDSAASYIRQLMEAEGNADMMLRLAVKGGGCQGFSYYFSFDSALQDGDQVFEKNGVKLVLDESTHNLVAGAEIDYVETTMGASFQIRNPLAKSSCGCGSSFSA